jgi:hypothetical protein
MSTLLADALLTIGERPLCSVEVEKSDDVALWFYFQNGIYDDCVTSEELTDTLATYDQIGTPYSLTVLLPLPAEDYDAEPEGWQGPTIDERNALALAYA